jgi:hypothetical protein
MAGIQGPAQLPENLKWPAKAAESVLPISAANKGTESAKKQFRRWREGHHKEIVFHAPATVRAVTKNSITAGDRHSVGSVLMPVAAHLNAFWSGRGVGRNAIPFANEFHGDRPDILLNPMHFR